MSILGLLIFLIQSLAFAYFFTGFLGSKNRLKNSILIVLAFNLIFEPIAIFINNSYITMPTTMILTFILLRVLYKEESIKRCILAVFLYEGCMILCEMISLIFLLLAGINPTPAISTYQYAIGFYILHFTLMMVSFTFIIYRFKSNRTIEDAYMPWESILLAMAILTCIITTSFYYTMSISTLLIYSCLFIITAIFLFKKNIEYQNRKKQEITLQYLQDSLHKQAQKYIQLRNEEQFRKLRHDYINFIEQRNNGR